MLETPNTGTKVWNIEWKLVGFIFYISFLIASLFTGHTLNQVAIFHLCFVVVFSLFYFGFQFIYILVAPLMPFFMLISQFFARRYLRKFKQNVHEDVVIVLAHSDWTKLEAWVKPNYFVSEIKVLVRYLQKKKQNFSFYTHATMADVESIMRDQNVREVYFVGHGSSHLFQLKTDEILYYCEFNNPMYGKDYVHQVHCGTTHGKSLSDYVVPEGNKQGCFLVRKSITGPFIEKQFENKIKELSK
jgi:hypothetical protein